ncbi:MAG TPA: sn-glycerol-3-phosphate ABC transporter ATP-binding protein UgpC [Thermoleophilia bacterium]|nr:sn-glycerol-3-phosphate ABC transporter ATP-binding protein UgpC [Thermoleophilia bacterium]
MAEIRYEHVSKAFDANTVVSDLDLRIDDGELMVLVGPSGCGKTTALRMLAGLEEVSSGQIVIDEQVVNDLEPRDRDIAMVFQNYALYPHLSVYQNMAFGLRLHHEPKAEIERRVGEAARVLQLEELLQRKPKQLSGGQRQRVAMGRAIVRQPKVFLMDEPLSNLDAKLRVQMRAMVARLQRDLGVTMLYVTHDQVEAMTLGHRVAVMRQGMLQQVAPPKELYGRPVNLFVASFIGSPAMNVVEAELHREADGLRARFGPHDIRIDAGLAASRAALEGYNGRTVVLGVRPQNTEDAALVDSGGTDSMIVATVELREDLGPEVDVHVGIDAPVPALEAVIEATESADATSVAGRPEGIFVARLGAGTEARVGRPVKLWLDPRALHFFDPDSGAAIYE